MTHKVLPHGRLEFTLEDGSVWLFRLPHIEDVAMVMPIPTPKVLTNEPTQKEPVNECKPASIVRAETIERVHWRAEILYALSIKPKLVRPDEEIVDGADAAYLHEMGLEAIGVANRLLMEAGVLASDDKAEDDLKPFPGDGESGAD